MDFKISIKTEINNNKIILNLNQINKTINVIFNIIKIWRFII